jgi:nicotinate dehydrogenase subunit A
MARRRHPKAQHRTKGRAEIVERFQLTVDGSVRSVEYGPNTPLLYVLRNDLGIAAVRFGCGEGMCGACDVLVDGRALSGNLW